jgi:hypothetical protein
MSTPRESRFMTFVKQAAAVVGLVSAVFGLVFLLLPQLRPDVSQGTPPATTQEDTGPRSGRLSAIVLDDRTTQRQYHQRADLPSDGFTEAQLARIGAFVQFRIELTGYRDREVRLRRELVDARTGDEIGQVQTTSITPRASPESAPWPDWVALRPGTGRYVLVYKLVDPGRRLTLDCIPSPAFGGLAGIEPETRPLALCPTS